MIDTLIGALGKGFDYFEKGGVLAWPILLCSLIAAGFIIERFWYYRTAFKDGEDWLGALMDLLEKGDREAARDLAQSKSSPTARVLAPMLSKAAGSARFSRTALEKTANHHGAEEVRGLDRRLSTLSSIGNLAPLLGLMGTVLGLIKAFMEVESMGGKVNASALAGGIWEALLTTLFGLGVAIPTVFAYNYFLARENEAAGRMQAAAGELLEALEELEENKGAGP